MNKRITSLLLAIIMVFSMLATAVPAFALGEEHQITVHGGRAYNADGDEITNATAGTVVTITAGLAPDDLRFDGWRTSSDIHLKNALAETTTFIMPDQPVELDAHFAPIYRYSITVNGGKAYNADGDEITNATAGTVVTVTANPAHNGLRFNGWKTSSDIHLKNALAETTTFVMPDRSVELTVGYMNYPEGNYIITGDQYIIRGEDAVFVCNTLHSKFESVILDGEVVAPDHYTVEVSGDRTTITLSAAFVGALRIMQFYELRICFDDGYARIFLWIVDPNPPSYPITVDGGYASTSAGPVNGSVAEGAVVTITANIPADMWFKKWEVVAGEVLLHNELLEETTFRMPNSAVSVKAVYEPIPERIFDIAVNIAAPVAGESASFEFDVSPGAGYKMHDRSDNGSGHYCSWAEFDTAPSEVDLGNADWKVSDEPFAFQAGKFYAFTAYLEVEEGYRFELPPKETTATVNGAPAECSPLTYRYANLDYLFYCEDPTSDTYPIVVNNGEAFVYGEGYKEIIISEAQAGTEVRIRANTPPEGMEFDCWVVNYGNLNFSSVYSTDIITMPTNAVILTAHYTEKTEKEYFITSGDWRSILGKSASFVSDAPYEKFEKVRVDNADVSSSDYTLANENGATKITFNAAFISSLYVGTHALRIVSSDGAARTSFSVCNGISTIEVTDVVPPVAGELSDFTFTMPADAGYQPYSGGQAYWLESLAPLPVLKDAGEWQYWVGENKTGDASAWDGTPIRFRAGYYYTFYRSIELKRGFAYEKDVSVTVNGKDGQFLKDWGPLSEAVIYTFGPLPGTAASPLVKVTPSEAKVLRGSRQQFTATVEGLEDQSVEWSLKGRPTSDDTKISANGLLTVGADETAESLEVVALSTAVMTHKLTGTATVTILENQPVEVNIRMSVTSKRGDETANYVVPSLPVEIELFGLADGLSLSDLTLKNSSLTVPSIGSNEVSQSLSGSLVFTVDSAAKLEKLARGFYIREKNGGAEDWTYSDAVYHVVGTKGTDGEYTWTIYRTNVVVGEVGAGVTYQDGESVSYMDFINYYGTIVLPFAPFEISIPLSKTVALGEDTPVAPYETFWFEIFRPGADLSAIKLKDNDVTVSGEGTYTPSVIVSVESEEQYELLKDGFYLREKQGNAQGWTYSDKVYCILPGRNDWFIYGTSDDENLSIQDTVEAAAFTNIFTGLLPFDSFDISIPISKTVALDEDTASAPNKTFRFEIFQDWADLSTITVSGDSIETNGAGSYTGTMTVSIESREDYNLIGNGFYLREKQETARGWTYSDTVYRVLGSQNGCMVYELDADGEMPLRETPDAAASFTNIYSSTRKVSGTVTSFGTAADVTVQLIKNGATTPAYETTVSSTANSENYTSTYSFAKVLPGTYTMRVSKQSHVTREYTVTITDADETLNVEIRSQGDIDGNGKITTMDFVRANSHARGVKLMTDYELQCADVVGTDGRVTTMDATRINSYAKLSASVPS